MTEFGRHELHSAVDGVSSEFRMLLTGEAGGTRGSAAQAKKTRQQWLEFKEVIKGGNGDSDTNQVRRMFVARYQFCDAEAWKDDVFIPEILGKPKQQNRREIELHHPEISFRVTNYDVASNTGITETFAV